MAGQKNKLTPLGKEIKKRLIDMGMTQKELAAMLGVKRAYISRIMYGNRTGKKYRKAIAEILGIDEAA